MKKYNIENLNRVAHPDGLAGVASHFGQKLNRQIHKVKGLANGTDVVEEEWDNLLILDGCRYDTFADCCELNGKLEQRRSQGSESGEYIRNNFIGRELHDTVYITSNPFAPAIPEETFYYIENLLESDWDPELKSVPPEPVADRVRNAAEQFSHKRLIAHFMQPHYPFIGEFGQQLETGGISPVNDETDESLSVWSRLQYGLGISKDDVQRAYRENLEYVLNTVESLVDDLFGKTVITSDHGNLMGDRLRPIPVRGYGHPPNLYVDPLIVVPWFVINDERREITADQPMSSERLDMESLGEQLEALGYK